MKKNYILISLESKVFNQLFLKTIDNLDFVCYNINTEGGEVLV